MKFICITSLFKWILRIFPRRFGAKLLPSVFLFPSRRIQFKYNYPLVQDILMAVWWLMVANAKIAWSVALVCYSHSSSGNRLSYKCRNCPQVVQPFYLPSVLKISRYLSQMISSYLQPTSNIPYIYDYFLLLVQMQAIMAGWYALNVCVFRPHSLSVLEYFCIICELHFKLMVIPVRTLRRLCAYGWSRWLPFRNWA